jgi:hypothetical protein
VPTPISVAGDITDVAFDMKRGVMYLLQSNADDIAIVSLGSGTVVGTIALPDYAPAFDLTPGGDSIIAVLKNSQELGVVDLTQASPTVATVPLTDLDSTYLLLDIKVASTGLALISVQHFVVGGVTRLYSYSLSSGTLSARLDAPEVGYNFGGVLARSADSKVIIVNGGAGAFLRYDAGTDAFGLPQSARIPYVHPAVDATGAHVAISGDLYDASLQFARSARVALNGEGPAAISPDGQTHFMALEPAYTERGIVRSRVSDGSIIDHIAVPMLISMLRVSPDSATLVVIGGSQIVLVNLLQLH